MTETTRPTARSARRYMTQSEVRRLLRISKRQVDRLRAAGEFEAIDISASPQRGRPTYRYLRDSVEQFVNRRRRPVQHNQSTDKTNNNTDQEANR